MRMFVRVFPVLLVISSLIITGCVTPRPAKKDPTQSGMFTGKSGKLVIYSNKTRKRR